MGGAGSRGATFLRHDVGKECRKVRLVANNTASDDSTPIGGGCYGTIEQVCTISCHIPVSRQKHPLSSLIIQKVVVLQRPSDTSIVQ